MKKFNRLKLLREDFEKFIISYISEIMEFQNLPRGLVKHELTYVRI